MVKVKTSLLQFFFHVPPKGFWRIFSMLSNLTTINPRTYTQSAEALIVEDPTITLRFLALELVVSYGRAHAIAHEQLGRSKRYARWVPHQLTIEQKEQRVAICRNWLHEFEPNGPQRFSDDVTGNECWISFFTMKDKHSNMVWLAENEPRPEVLKTGFRSRKRMFTIFFNIQVPVIVYIMPDKAMITAHIIQLQFCQKFFCIFGQRHGLDVGL